jgi:hypothetical protein
MKIDVTYIESEHTPFETWVVRNADGELFCGVDFEPREYQIDEDERDWSDYES